MKVRIGFPALMDTTVLPSLCSFAFTIDSSPRTATAVLWYSSTELFVTHSGAEMVTDGLLEFLALDPNLRDRDGRLVWAPQSVAW